MLTQAIFLAMLFAASAQVGGAESQALPASALETAATVPGAHVVWSNVAGGLTAPGAKVVVTALVVRGDEQVRRGVRLDLGHLRLNPNCELKYVSWSVLCARANAALYFDEPDLPALERDLTSGTPIDGALITSYRWRGRGTSGSGIIVGGYGLEGYTLPELGALVARAMADLASAPR